MANSRVCSIPDCGKPARGRGWCSSHYQRWFHHGDPLGGGTSKGMVSRYLVETVLPHNGDECLIWPYARNKGGYGNIRIGCAHKSVHRVVCEEIHGPPPTPDHEASHSCGNGHLGCVSPRHLSWKTTAQNQRDRIPHGTSHRGSRHYRSSITEEQARQIKSLKGEMRRKDICAQYGVSKSVVDCIFSGVSWGWLE